MTLPNDLRPRVRSHRFRIRAALAVLRGRPVAYRITVQDGVIAIPPGVRGAVIAECTFTGFAGPSVRAS